jgi:hypothetical protein
MTQRALIVRKYRQKKRASRGMHLCMTGGWPYGSLEACDERRLNLNWLRGALYSPPTTAFC